MNEIKVTVELCTEDRARLDKIIEGLSKPHNCDKCVEAAVAYVTQTTEPTPAQTEEAPTEEPADAPAPTVEAPKEESPAEAEKTATETAPAVTKADIQQKVVALVAAGKKAEVKAIVNAYADRVSAIPEDKVAEVWANLTALEA